MPSRCRRSSARWLALLVAGWTIGIVLPEHAGASVTAAGATCTLSTPTPSTTGGLAYYLFESNGAVASCGGAPLHGVGKATRRVPIVAGAATAGGAGYWLVTAAGAVEAFGNAGTFGSTAHLRLHAPVVAFAPTPDGGGYWLVTATGTLFHFGDAGFFGSTVRDHHDGTVVALVPTPDGQGYWIVSSTGTVRALGDAEPLGSLPHRRPSVVAAAGTPDGRGLVLLTKKGGVEVLGTGGFYGSLVHRHMARPLTAIASSTDGAGYIAVNAAGSVFNFGNAPFDGSLAGAAPRRPTAVVALAPVTLPAPVSIVLTSVSAPTSLIPHGVFGYDISNFQCAKPGSSSASSSLPMSSPFTVIEAAGWLDSSTNSCLAAEATWATAAAGIGGAHYNLYLFLNSPDQSSGASALDGSGPAGTCATIVASARAACLAYNYGYQGATHVFANASGVGVTSQMWWLDVEGSHLSPNQWSNYSAGEFWSSSTSLNDDTIQGALDALRAQGATVGIYSSSVQYATIAGGFVPSGAQVPLWVAGAPWTNPPYTESGLPAPGVLASWCAGTSGYSSQYPTDVFAGGVPWILQETPGSEPSPYNIDPDYAC